MPEIKVIKANSSHVGYVQDVCDMIAEAAKSKNSGLALRTPEYIHKKIEENKSIIALVDGSVAGFCYIETWSHGKYVANSGLIVSPKHRGQGLAKLIKEKAFELSREMYPDAKIFGLTTSLAVMKINSHLGYRPVTFDKITDDDMFWKGCETCQNYDILQRTARKNCLCTGMLFDPKEKNPPTDGMSEKTLPTYGRWLRFKNYVLKKLR